MSPLATHAATTPIPVQLSEPECNACIFPHLSRPTRGPQGTLGSHRLFHLIFWVLYTGMPWKCWPIPQDAHGKPAIHDTHLYRAFALWADEGALQQAFMASVGSLSEEKTLDVRVWHGEGTKTVAKQGEMGVATRAPSTRRERTSWS